MKLLIAQLALAVGLAILQASFMSALPGPLPLVNLPLMLVIALFVGLRPGAAFGAAALSAVTVAGLASVSAFALVPAALTAAAVTHVLLSRVLSHLSTMGFVGANAVAFLVFNIGLVLFGACLRFFIGQESFPPGTLRQVVSVLAALPIHLAACLAVRYVTVRGRARAALVE